MDEALIRHVSLSCCVRLQVLILILMDEALILEDVKEQDIKDYSFNPYFNG